MNNIIQWPFPYDSVDWGGRHRCHGDGGNWSCGRPSERAESIFWIHDDKSIYIEMTREYLSSIKHVRYQNLVLRARLFKR